MSTGVPVHHYTCSVYLFLFGITSTINFQLIYWGTYTQIYPKIMLPVYLHASLLSNHKDLPVTTTTCVHAHTSTRSRFYCSTCPQMYLFICIPVQFASYFSATCTMTFQLIYWGTYTQIHPKIYLPVYLHAFLSSNHKDLPVTTTTCVHAQGCTRSWPYLFMFILSFWLTV